MEIFNNISELFNIFKIIYILCLQIKIFFVFYFLISVFCKYDYEKNLCFVIIYLQKILSSKIGWAISFRLPARITFCCGEIQNPPSNVAMMKEGKERINEKKHYFCYINNNDQSFLYLCRTTN